MPCQYVLFRVELFQVVSVFDTVVTTGTWHGTMGHDCHDADEWMEHCCDKSRPCIDDVGNLTRWLDPNQNYKMYLYNSLVILVPSSIQNGEESGLSMVHEWMNQFQCVTCNIWKHHSDNACALPIGVAIHVHLDTGIGEQCGWNGTYRAITNYR